MTPLFIVGVLAGELIPPVFADFLWFSFVPIGILLILGRRASKLFFPLLSVALFCFGIGTNQSIRESVGTLIHKNVPRTAKVIEAEPSNNTWKKLLIEVKAEKRGNQWCTRKEKVVLYSKDSFHKGDIFLFRANLQPIKNSGNPGEFDLQGYWHGKNIVSMGFLASEDYTLLDFEKSSRLSQFFEGLRSHLTTQLERHLSPQEASLAKALLLGDKSTLSPETREAFSRAGAMHVLAISGLHVGIIMYLLFFLLKRLHRWISKRTAIIISIAFIWIFVGVTGGGASVMRSALMFSILLIGQQMGRSGNNFNTLFFSAFVLLLMQPLLIFDLGFQLSYGAMLGIFLFFERIQGLVTVSSKWLQKAWDGTALGIAAQALTIPLVLYYFHQFPNYFWLTNLGIMVLAGAILAVGLLFFSASAIPGLGWLLAVLLGWAVWFLLIFVGWIDALPSAVAVGFAPGFLEIMLFYVSIIMLSWQFRKRWIPIVGGLSLLTLLSFWQFNRYELSVKQEVVVFNSNQPVIAVKFGKTIYGFYSSNNKVKATRLLQAYMKVAPGELRMKPLKNGVTKVGNSDNKLEIDCDPTRIQLTGQKIQTVVRLRYSNQFSSGGDVIDMPYLESSLEVTNLRKGAVIIPL